MPLADPLHTPDTRLQALYGAHHGWLLGWLRKKLNNQHQAADLTHDTFARLLGMPPTTSSTPGALALRSPRAYLTTIARGLMIDSFRRADLEQAYLADLAALPPALHPSPEERLLALQTLEALGRILDAMTPKTRQAWLLSRLDGLAHADIAAQMKVSVPRVRQYLTNAARLAYQLQFGEAR